MRREKFNSRLGFILVSAGCAIGLGNVWTFPYMVGMYGGAAFILIYLLFLIIMGLPFMVCEFAVGRASQKSIATSFDTLEPKGSRWHYFRYFGMAGNYLLVMFYSMVGGWMLYYCLRLARGEFTGQGPEQISAGFQAMQSSWPVMFFWTIVVILLSFGICVIGLQQGVEKVTKVMMLGLLGLMVILAIHSVMLEGAAEGVKFYLVPDFKKMMDQGIGTVIFAAMSQAFFTLSVGMGGMAIFGSYLNKDRSLTGEAIHVIILDTFVALTAGLIVIPACFSYGIEPGAGPGLVFLSLPTVFAKMAGGRIWGALFFLFLSFAAISTVIGVFENIISFAIDLFGWSRKKAVLVNAVVIILFSLPCILGFNVLKSFQPLGAGTNIMDLEDFLVSSNIMPLGSAIYLMFCVHKNGWGWDNFIHEVNSGHGIRFPQWIRGYLTFVLPLLVGVIYLKGYHDLFRAQGQTVYMIWMTIAVIFLGMVIFIAAKKPSPGQKK